MIHQITSFITRSVSFLFGPKKFTQSLPGLGANILISSAQQSFNNFNILQIQAMTAKDGWFFQTSPNFVQKTKDLSRGVMF